MPYFAGNAKNKDVSWELKLYLEPENRQHKKAEVRDREQAGPDDTEHLD